MKPRHLIYILPLLALAGLGYVGYTTYKDLNRIQEDLNEPSAPTRTESTRSAEPFSAAIEAEKKGKWNEAADLFRAAEKERKSDLIPQKLEAIKCILLGEESENKGNLQDALSAYKKAFPALSDPSLISKRIERLEQRTQYQVLYEQGIAAETAGKWQEAAEAFDEARKIAPQIGIPTADIMDRIRKNRERAVRLERELDGYYWLFEAFSALDDPYAIIALCDYYSPQEIFLSFRSELETRRANAAQAILSRRAEFSRLAAEQDETFVKVRFKGGTTVEGALVSEDDVGLVILELRDCQYGNRLIAKTAAEKIEKRNRSAEDANNERAEALLGVAVKTCAERPSEALGAIGKLLYEFPAARILNDPQTQRTIILAASLSVARKHGDSIPKLLASNVEFFKKICPVCGGKGRAICPQCKGTGTIFVQCPNCKGTGEARCGACGGSGNVTEGEDGPVKRCPACNGTGVRVCGNCGGDRGFHTLCRRCRNGYLTTCPCCHGTGQRPAGKYRPEDISNLKKATQPQ